MKLFEYRYTKIAYSVHGEDEAEAVLLLHGFGEDSRVWKHQVEVWSKRYKLIVPDLPGSGLSDMLDMQAWEKQDWIAQFGNVMHLLMQQEGIEKYVIMGHSMGGYIALQMMNCQSESVVALGLLHSTAFADDNVKIEARKKGIQFIKKFGAARFLEQSVPNLFGNAFTHQHIDAIEEQIKQTRYFKAEVLEQYYEAMIFRNPTVEVLKNISRPIWFLIGEEDKSVALADSLSQCHIPISSMVTILPQAGHMGIWESPEKVNIDGLHFLSFSFQAEG